jgi:hypothetical protein
METEAMPTIVKRLSKMNPAVAIGGSITAIALLCYIPLSKYQNAFFSS